jgi:hypothetical protein
MRVMPSVQLPLLFAQRALLPVPHYHAIFTLLHELT